MRTQHQTLILVAIMLIAVSSVVAALPTTMSYQGLLTNAVGTPLTGTYMVTFRIFNVATGGSAIWSEMQSVTATEGLFSVNLGSVQPLNPTVFSDPNNPSDTDNRYLEIHIALQLLPLSPRTQLVCSPYSFVAGSVAGSGTTLSEQQLALGNVASGQTVKLSSTELLFDSGLPNMGPARSPLAVNFSARMSACSLSFADTTGETLAVLDGSNGRFALSSRSEAAIRMYSNASSMHTKLGEIMANSSEGPALRFFSAGSEVMGVEPSPFSQCMELNMYHPQFDTPAKLIQLSTDYDGTSSGESFFRMYNVPTSPGGESTLPQVYLTSRISGGEMRLGAVEDSPSGAYIKANSNRLSSSILLRGSPVLPPGVTPVISMAVQTGSSRIGIGTSSPTEALHVVGNICYTGTIGACSDERFKKDMEPIDHALDAVDKLTGIRYSWRADEFPDQQFGLDRQVGVTAQEVKQVLPEAVRRITTDTIRLTTAA